MKDNNPTSFERWIKKAKSHSPEIRIEAFESLPDHNDADAIIDQLTSGLQDDEALVRLTAAEQLGQFPAERSRTALIGFIERETDDLARAHAFSSLGMIGKPEDIHALYTELKSPRDTQSLIHAAVGLFESARRTASTCLLEQIQHELPEIRNLASEALNTIVAAREDGFIAKNLELQIHRETDPDARQAQRSALEWVNYDENPL